MLEKLKSLYRATPLYTGRFARLHASKNEQRTAEDRALREVYSQFVARGDLVFDIGANVGQHTKLFLDLGCEVVAIEPQRNCVAALRRSFGNRIQIVQSAVTDRAGTATLMKHDTMHPMATLSGEWLSRLDTANDWFRRERVQTTTFDNLISRFGTPKFAKIDVEGCERQVFAGLSKSPDAVRFEFACEMLADAKSCINKLQSLGNYEFNYSPSLSTTMQLPNWLPHQEFEQFLTGAKWGDVWARRAV
jgi:FkbM family methyltransferase